MRSNHENQKTRCFRTGTHIVSCYTWRQCVIRSWGPSLKMAWRVKNNPIQTQPNQRGYSSLFFHAGLFEHLDQVDPNALPRFCKRCSAWIRFPSSCRSLQRGFVSLVASMEYSGKRTSRPLSILFFFFFFIQNEKKHAQYFLRESKISL